MECLVSVCIYVRFCRHASIGLIILVYCVGVVYKRVVFQRELKLKFGKVK